MVTASLVLPDRYNESRSTTYKITTKTMYRETITLDCQTVQDCVDLLRYIETDAVQLQDDIQWLRLRIQSLVIAS